MKRVKGLILMFVLLAVSVLTVEASDVTEVVKDASSGVWNWVMTIGLGSLAAMLPAFWKKAKTLSLKIADLVILVMDELDNVKTQVIEVKTAARILVEHYKDAIKDNVLSPEEQADFVKKFEVLIDELDDVPSAFATAIKTIRDHIRNWYAPKK